MQHEAPYRPEIDGLRALAVVAVIVNHLGKDLLPAGYLGVDIFFVISGFVITSSLAGRTGESLGDFLASFYTRRIKRLVPALVLCVVATGFLLCLFDPTPAASLRTGLAALFGLSNLYLFKQASDYFGNAAELDPFTHTWSLGVEEQFYFVFPLLFWLTHRGRFVYLVAGLSAASLAGFVFLYGTHQPAAYFLMPARLWELGAGCLLFRMAGWPSRAAGRAVPLAATAGLVGALFVPPSLAVPATIAVVVLTAILIASLRPGTAAYALFAHPWAVYAGTISYSLYLWHWSVITLSRWTIGIHAWTVPLQLGLMLLLAAASYRYVEAPLRRAEWSARRWRPIGYGLGASAAGSLALLYLLRVDAGSLFTGKRAGAAPAAANAFMAAPRAPRRGTLALIGDSHARHFAGLAKTVADELGLEPRLVSRGGTPFPTVNLTTPVGGRTLRRNQAANAERASAVREVMATKPRLVILSSFYQFYFDVPAGSRRHQRLTHYGANGEEIGARQSFELWLDDLEKFARMHPETRIVLFLSTPEMPGIYPRRLCGKEWFRPHPSEKCVAAIPRGEVVARLGRVNGRIAARAARLENVLVFDPLPALCPPTRAVCGSHDGAERLYHDEHHLTRAGARKVTDSFLRFLAAHEPQDTEARR
jgi:peptidoglycan/LPS O-acetylase OafA/YrhL